MGDDPFDRLSTVLRESIVLGARSYTTNLQGLPTIRIHLEPERASIASLRVFLAHAFADREWADEVNELLTGLGFNVTYLRGGGALPASSTNEISTKLVAAIGEGDYLCLLLSPKSASRDWVRFELQYASRIIGRVTILTSPDYDFNEFAWPKFADKAMLTAKYGQLAYDRDDPNMALRLGRALINHPDEGVTDGTYRPLTIRERDLHAENQCTQRIRRQLNEMDEYTSRHVVDVVPFSWERCQAAVGDVPGVIEWLCRNHGRLNMAVQVARANWRVSLIHVPHVAALVLWKDEWNPEWDQVPNRTWT